MSEDYEDYETVFDDDGTLLTNTELRNIGVLYALSALMPGAILVKRDAFDRHGSLIRGYVSVHIGPESAMTDYNKLWKLWDQKASHIACEVLDSFPERQDDPVELLAIAMYISGGAGRNWYHLNKTNPEGAELLRSRARLYIKKDI